MWQLQPGILSRAALDAVAGIPLSIGGTPVTTGTVGAAYAGFTVTAAGGTSPYTYSVASGSLPAGITLNSSSGVVSGTPTTAGVYASIVIRATDAVSATADLASFAITVSAGAAPLDAVASVTGAWSFSRNMLTSFGAGTRYTKASGVLINSLKDQSGNGRHFDSTTTANQPSETTAFPTNVLCADLDGVNDFFAGPAFSSFIAASSGAFVVSVIIDAVTLNTGTSYSNHGIFGDSGAYIGLHAANLSGVTFYAFNWDGNVDNAITTGTTGTPYVIMWRHHGGNINISINGGSETTVASGNTSNLTGVLYLGSGAGATSCNCKIAEVFATSNGSQTAALAAAIANMKTYIGA